MCLTCSAPDWLLIWVGLANGKVESRTDDKVILGEQRTMISLSRRLVIVIVMAVPSLAGSSLTALSWARGGPGRKSAHGFADPSKASEAGKKCDEKKKGLPLTPDRTIEFTAEEGTWVSLD